MNKLIAFPFAAFLFLTTSGSAQALVRFDFEQPYFLEPGFVVKDHSLIRVGSVYHLFYLRGTPAVRIGHAASSDLVHWNLEEPVLYVEPGTWDEKALWAPQVIHHPKAYLMYYTGVNYASSQQTGMALSTDLYLWAKVPWPLYHPDPSWAEWSDSTWSHGRDPFVFEYDGTKYMLVTAKTNTNRGAIASAISNDWLRWEENGPIYIHDTWHVLESVQCVYRNDKFHLFFTEEEVLGISHMASDSLYSGWDISTRTIVDMGYAAEIDLFDGNYIFSRHAVYNDNHGTATYVIRFDTVLWVGDTPTVHKPWPLSKDWDLIDGIAFAYQPTYGDNPYARGESLTVGFEGNCWIGTKERYQGPLMHFSPGGAQGDGATGMIRSKPFTITGYSMNLLVGGGEDPNACYVALVDSATGTVLFKETGKDTDQMDRRYWDLKSHRGRRVYLEIADLSSSTFGHINCDDIRESMEVLNPQGGNRKKSKYKPRVSNSLENIISETTLFQNVPNPFNPTTTISYYLAAESHITLDIFDVNGTLVRNLAKAKSAEGLHQVEWDGRNDRGEFLSTGIYFYRLAVNGNTIDTKKMILLK